MVRAVSEIRFDSRRWLSRYPDVAAVERRCCRSRRWRRLRRMSGIALVRGIALDPAYQLK